VQISETVRDFIAQELAADREGLSLRPEDDLVGQGVLDSVGILQLASFLEKSFGIKIGDDDMVPENFGSIARIERFVLARKGQSQ
jgi:acyl carrier protein